MTQTTCKICGKQINTYSCRIKKNLGKFCSRSCFYKYRKGKCFLTEKGRKIQFQTHLGNQYALGRKWSPEERERRIKTLPRGKNNWRWNNGKTINLGYVRLTKLNGQKQQLEHRIIMEKLIGRFLKPKEIVHHWDRNRINNNKSNLCLFKNGASHIRLHQFAKRHKLDINSLRFEQPWLLLANQ